MCLVLRREGKELLNYVHLGTGNYHPKTAQLYTDYGLFSCNKELGEDVRRVFTQLTSLGKVTKLNKLLQSPFTLHRGILEKIEREIKNGKDDPMIERSELRTWGKHIKVGNIEGSVLNICRGVRFCDRPFVKKRSAGVVSS